MRRSRRWSRSWPGQLRAVAVAAPQRLAGPQSAIPTWKEQGFDVVEGNWRGIVGPPKLGAGELAYWDSRVAALVKTDAWADILKKYHWDAAYADSADAKRFLDTNMKSCARRWRTCMQRIETMQSRR